MNRLTKNKTKAIVYSCCWWAWVGLAGWREQCRPEAWAVRGKASMPEAPLWRGGIATNVQILAFVWPYEFLKL
jgi:hypothetical protein